MLKLEIIGNLGADAELREANGKKYVSFRVAETRKFADKQTGEMVSSTTWASCSMDGDNTNLLPYLKKGQRVFVRGNMELKIFVSSRDGQRHAGVNVYVKELELCGSPRTDMEMKGMQAPATKEPEKKDDLPF